MYEVFKQGRGLVVHTKMGTLVSRLKEEKGDILKRVDSFSYTILCYLTVLVWVNKADALKIG